ncbi:MAG: hypothetical protein LBQ70_05850 [Prevotellaceae bacterium]|jgi:hypothetical protein|nr:hypothetical protein [Prevotellaceae bacterium]
MKTLVKKLCVVSILLTAGNFLNAQLYLGPGGGLDYGGLGGKIEYLPVKYLGVSGGFGYNFLYVGWNVGVNGKIRTGDRVQLSPTVLYGYNGVFSGEGNYPSMVSYGVSAGFNIDIAARKAGNKWSIGFFYPFRTSEFLDYCDTIRRDSSMGIFVLLPITISVGYNFRL